MANKGAEVNPDTLRKGDKVYINHKNNECAYLFIVKDTRETKLSGESIKHRYVKLSPYMSPNGSKVTASMRREHKYNRPKLPNW